MYGASLNQEKCGERNIWMEQQLSSAGKSLGKCIEKSMSAAASKTAKAAENMMSNIKCIFVVLGSSVCVAMLVLATVTEISGLALGGLAALGTLIAIPACTIGVCLIVGKIIS